MERLKDIRAVIKDWDETVVKTIDSVIELFQSFALNYQLEIHSKSSVLQHWGKPLPVLLSSLWPDFKPEDLYQNFENWVPEEFCPQPFPKSKESIIKLKDMGIVLGIISSGSQRRIQKVLDNHFLIPNSYFEFIHTAEGSRYHKPDPRVFDLPLELLSKKGIKKEETLYIGDSLDDLNASFSRNILFFGVTTGNVTKGEFIKNGLQENQILEGFWQLPDLIKKTKSSNFTTSLV